MAHRDWMGSITLALALHASAKRVVEEWISIVRRSACCAPVVMLHTTNGSRTDREIANIQDYILGLF